MESAPQPELPGAALQRRDPSPMATAPLRDRGEALAHPMDLEARERALYRARFGATTYYGDWSPAIPVPAVEPRSRPGAAVLLGLLRGLWRTPLRFVLGGLALYVFVFSLSVVRGGSMAPGIHDGDRILIDQVSYLFQEVERGDIVVLRYPLDPTLDYIKRVVGLPGDELVMASGQLWINGVEVVEPYVDEVDPYTHLYVRVREGHFFVLGDNRLHSSDSREFGQVAEGLLRGKVDLRLWPPGRLGRIE